MHNDLIFEDKSRGITVYLKREDLLHPVVSGNKFRKLKYNLVQALAGGHSTILTFGGAFSNHIAATAFAGQQAGLKTIGVIRGDELVGKVQQNPTLRFAQSCGMQFEFVDRETYRRKTEPEMLAQWHHQFGDFYHLPEGGTNALAVRGCAEILTEEDARFDIVCCAVGTGGTLAGLINSCGNHQQILGFPALKGDFLTDEIRTFVTHDRWRLVQDYHFGGYGKIEARLIGFMNEFSQSQGILLDPLYTGKMLFGVMDLIEKDYFRPGTQILAIHTGGLQGIDGMNNLLQQKNLPLINTHV